MDHSGKIRETGQDKRGLGTGKDPRALNHSHNTGWGRGDASEKGSQFTSFGPRGLWDVVLNLHLQLALI